MSNEELAVRIQAGERELIPDLWDQVRRFVWQQARRRFVLTEGYGGVEVEDLAQSGFLALLEAVESFEPEGEYKFLTYLSYHLKNAFAAAGGYKTSKRDPLNCCTSLDTPLDDSPNGDTLLDLQADPVDPFIESERRIWLEQLRAALECPLADLSEEQRETLHRRYWLNQTLEEAAAASGVDMYTAKKRERAALDQIRKRKHQYGLDQFVEERTPYYAHVGVSAFNATHTSAVELAVLKRERLEKLYNSRQN